MISIVGLGSGGCHFLRDMPVAEDMTTRRIAIDSDAKILRDLAGNHGVQRILLKTPRGYSKASKDAASARIRDAWEAAKPDWLEALEASRLVFLSVALGGVSGTTLAPLFLEAMRARRLPTATLALLGGASDDRVAHTMGVIASHSVSVCAVSAHQLGQALNRQTSVPSWIGFCSFLRLGHVMDWQRVSPFLADSGT